MQIVLVAQDGKKPLLRQWADRHRHTLERHDLTATGGTARILAELGLRVRALASGPMGGDLHAAHIVATEQPGACIFFRDPMTWPAHDADVAALVRLAILHNVPLAQNERTADAVLLAPAHRPALDSQLLAATHSLND
jgi:methylglyoxal synthase